MPYTPAWVREWYTVTKKKKKVGKMMRHIQGNKDNQIINTKKLKKTIGLWLAGA